MREQRGEEELVPFSPFLTFCSLPTFCMPFKSYRTAFFDLSFLKAPQNPCYAGQIIEVQLEKFNATNLVTKHWLKTAAKKLEVIPTLVNLQQQQNGKLSNF